MVSIGESRGNCWMDGWMMLPTLQTCLPPCRGDCNTLACVGFPAFSISLSVRQDAAQFVSPSHSHVPKSCMCVWELRSEKAQKRRSRLPILSACQARVLRQYARHLAVAINNLYGGGGHVGLGSVAVWRCWQLSEARRASSSACSCEA